MPTTISHEFATNQNQTPGPRNQKPETKGRTFAAGRKGHFQKLLPVDLGAAVSPEELKKVRAKGPGNSAPSQRQSEAKLTPQRAAAAQ